MASPTPGTRQADEAKLCELGGVVVSGGSVGMVMFPVGLCRIMAQTWTVQKVEGCVPKVWPAGSELAGAHDGRLLPGGGAALLLDG